MFFHINRGKSKNILNCRFNMNKLQCINYRGLYHTFCKIIKEHPCTQNPPV